MDLRERLAQLRRAHGYTLRDLRARIAAATDEQMAISYLSALERVERTPSIDALTRIAAGYGITLQELLEPVDIASAPTEPRYSPVFENFARKRGLNEAEKEELWRVVYRGRRPETEDDWDLLFSALNHIDMRRKGS